MALTSWVPGADGSGYPAEHLPYGVVSVDGGRPRVGVRVGDSVVDLAGLAGRGLLDVAGDVVAAPSLNPLMALGPPAWDSVRRRLAELVCDPGARDRVTPALVPLRACRGQLPIEVADYVDFYSSLEHATNLGRLFRPGGDPLLPNWRHLPVGYHGRAGTVVVSGTPVPRPRGQLGPDDAGAVVVGPSRRLDIELELGFVVGAGSRPGVPVPVASVPEHVFGVALVNDWSARDIQAWEYQPLGPFLGKSFATTMAAWVTPLAALEACRVPGPAQQPEPPGYLRRDAPWGLALDLAVDLRPAGGAAPMTVSRTTSAGLYWTFPQQVAHLTVNGAHLRTGDLLASGAISVTGAARQGSLIELTGGGTRPLVLGDARRTFLEDGDEVTLRAEATVGDGVTLTLAPAVGRIAPPR